MDNPWSNFLTQLVEALETGIRFHPKIDIVRMEVGVLCDGLIANADHYRVNPIVEINSSFKREAPFPAPIPIYYNPEIGAKVRVFYQDGSQHDIGL